MFVIYDFINLFCQLFRAQIKKRKIIHVRRKSFHKNIINKTLHKEQKQHQQKKVETESRPKWMLQFDQCIICLEHYLTNETIRGLACGHNYHSDCIVQWLMRGNHCCPICRWPSYRLKHPIQTKHC